MRVLLRLHGDRAARSLGWLSGPLLFSWAYRLTVRQRSPKPSMLVQLQLRTANHLRQHHAMTDKRPWRGWYKLARWERRRQSLFTEHPLCVKCLERDEVTVADTADHVVPHRGDEDLFWHGELQALCASCHSKSKQLEEHGRHVVAYGPDGWPI